jgi:hypothetical protein
MIHDPNRRICAVCGRVLNHEDGLWVHPFGSPERLAADHPVIAVLDTEINPAQVIPRCDFCYADYPEWLLPVGKISVLAVDDQGNEIGQAMDDGLWGACGQCAHCIQGDHWEELLRRALTGYTTRTGTQITPEVAAGMTAIYQALRESVIGPLRRVENGAS